MQVYSSVNSQPASNSSSVNTTVAPSKSIDSASSNGLPLSSAVSATQATPQTDTVTISARAMSMSLNMSTSSTETANDSTVQPALPNDGEKVENYVHYKKAQAQYQFYSDLAGVANGSDSSMSATSAYIVKNNDEARAATVQAANMNNQQDMLNTYIETTQSINESV
ncbi:hypothetical protein [Shewanella sp. TC10]|uniref:hypothetical protein n=1 Tax=Shewanella sp. TC10 TaxID=1419739 RepID=UPI00129DEACE|nr:hypothetical protein [Shewanella sp. TC10]